MTETLAVLPLRLLQPAPDNIRTSEPGDSAAVDELATSVQAAGILEPLLVSPNGDRYLIVCGHRRFAAAQLVGLNEVPCVIRDMTKRERLEAMVIENLQRRSLSPIAEGQAFERMIVELGYTQGQVADRIGKSPGYVSRRILALTLPPAVRRKVEAKTISLDRALGYGQAPPENAFQADEELQRAWLKLRQEVVDYGDRRLVRVLGEFVKALQAAQLFQKRAS